MNTKTLGLVAVVLLAGPIAVNAQTVTYDSFEFITYVPLGQTATADILTSFWTFGSNGTFSETIQVTSQSDQTLASYSGKGTWQYGAPVPNGGDYLIAQSSNSMGGGDEFRAL